MIEAQSARSVNCRFDSFRLGDQQEIEAGVDIATLQPARREQQSD
jgi:hypothetical protein